MVVRIMLVMWWRVQRWWRLVGVRLVRLMTLLWMVVRVAVGRGGWRTAHAASGTRGGWLGGGGVGVGGSSGRRGGDRHRRWLLLQWRCRLLLSGGPGAHLVGEAAGLNKGQQGPWLRKEANRGRCSAKRGAA